MDIVGNYMYVVWSDGFLYRVALTPGGGVDMSTWTLVDNGLSGISWSTVTAMFSTQA